MPRDDSNQPCDRPRADHDHRAAVYFDPEGGIQRAEGLTSGDAAKIATGLVHRGERGYSGPATPTPANELVEAGKGADESWLQRQWRELLKSPVKIAVGVFVAVVAAVISSRCFSVGLTSASDDINEWYILTCKAKIHRVTPGLVVETVEIELESGQIHAAQLTANDVVIFECPPTLASDVTVIATLSSGERVSWKIIANPLAIPTLDLGQSPAEPAASADTKRRAPHETDAPVEATEPELPKGNEAPTEASDPETKDVEARPDSKADACSEARRRLDDAKRSWKTNGDLQGAIEFLEQARSATHKGRCRNAKLREDILSTLVDVLAGAAETSKASAAAEDYLRQFPSGRRARHVETVYCNLNPAEDRCSG